MITLALALWIVAGVATGIYGMVRGVRRHSLKQVLAGALLLVCYACIVVGLL